MFDFRRDKPLSWMIVVLMLAIACLGWVIAANLYAIQERNRLGTDDVEEAKHRSKDDVQRRKRPGDAVPVTGAMIRKAPQVISYVFFKARWIAYVFGGLEACAVVLGIMCWRVQIRHEQEDRKFTEATGWTKRDGPVLQSSRPETETVATLTQRAVSSSSSVKAVQEAIWDVIREERIQVGEQLPSIHMLAYRLDVAPTVIHDALERSEAMGLVAMSPFSGLKTLRSLDTPGRQSPVLTSDLDYPVTGTPATIPLPEPKLTESSKTKRIQPDSRLAWLGGLWNRRVIAMLLVGASIFAIARIRYQISAFVVAGVFVLLVFANGLRYYLFGGGDGNYWKALLNSLGACDDDEGGNDNDFGVQFGAGDSTPPGTDVVADRNRKREHHGAAAVPNRPS